MTRRLIGIDPGASGGIAIAAEGTVTAYKMPQTAHDIAQLIKILAPTEIWMEKVGTYMPGNSGPSAATFAEHVGTLKGVIAALGIPCELVPPKRWQKQFVGVPKGMPDTPHKDAEAKVKARVRAERKKLLKDGAKARCQALYPGAKITLATADALGIMWYGLQQDPLLAAAPSA